MPKNVIQILALLVVCNVAQASNWLSLGKSANKNDEIFMDVSSIKFEQGVGRASFKTTRKHHTTQTDGKWWSFDLVKTAFNCAEEMYRDEALNVYYEDGTSYSLPAEMYPRPWRPVAPDPGADLEMTFICSVKN